MSTTLPDRPDSRKTLRLWPGVALVTVQWLAWLVVPAVAPDAMLFAVAGAVLGGIAIAAWWLFFSRAVWPDRLGALVLVTVALVATPPFLHPSVQNGMNGMMFVMYVIPILSLAFVTWAAATRRLAPGVRRVTMAAAVLLASASMTLIRTDGLIGGGGSQLAWRWTPTAEERLLARTADVPVSTPPSEPTTAAVQPAPVEPAPLADATAPSPAREEPEAAGHESPAAAIVEPSVLVPDLARIEWPGFRGTDRDGIVHGTRIATDWSQSPPVELWRRSIGPGWSSFAVEGDLIYTQEQRGDEEVVSAYSLATGTPAWQHRDMARFWESNGGAGPRGTPTLHDGRVYTFGATGILNVLNARTGGVVWSRPVAFENSVNTPGWGFSSSPIVVGDLVVVAVSGVLAAYDLESGEVRWINRAPGGGSYSSPHLATIDGVSQILLMAGGGLRSVAPADGVSLWEHAWPGAPIIQPTVIEDGSILISTGGMTGALGTRRLDVARGPEGWAVEERWTSRGLKPYFNDLVVHEGHAYGFDGFILASVNIEDGERAWKGGRYGHGQLVLLPEQDLLLVLSEEGELALVSATPGGFTEVARTAALDGKTWNHPVLVGDILLVRNGEEMAAFRLPRADR